MQQLQKWEPKAVPPRHRMIMRLELRGLTRGEIAAHLGMSPHTLKYICESDIYKGEMAKLQDQADQHVVRETQSVKQKITELSRYGIEELDRILKERSTSARLKAEICWDVLDRAGHMANETPPETNSSDAYMEALNDAFQRRKEQQAAKKLLESSNPA